jgi:hypothetical protein
MLVINFSTDIQDIVSAGIFQAPPLSAVHEEQIDGRQLL